MKITLKDGSVKEYAESKTVIDIAYDISEGLARMACAGEIDGEAVDLRTVVDRDCSLNILTAREEAGLRVMRHTCSHVLAEAVKNLFPDAKLTIGPAIDTGYYYDFDAAPFSREDLDKIEKEMKKISFACRPACLPTFLLVTACSCCCYRSYHSLTSEPRSFFQNGLTTSDWPGIL